MVKSFSSNFISKCRVPFFLIAFLLVLAIQPVHADELSELQTIRQTITNSSYGMQATYNRISNIYSDIHTYLPTLNTISSRIYDLNTVFNRFDDVYMDTTGYGYKAIDQIRTNTANTANSVVNLLPTFDTRLSTIQQSTYNLEQVLANATDSAIRADYENRVSSINDDFLNSSSDSSVSLGDLGSAKDSVSELKGSLSGGASASSLWNVLSSDSDGWGWFSQATANDLDSSSSGGRLMSYPEYSYLQSYYDELGLSLGGDYND